MSKFVLGTIFAAAACGGLASFAAAAEIREASISYDPAELGSSESAREVYKRIRINAKRACEATSPLMKRDQMRCKRELEERLVLEVADPVLLAVHRKSSATERIVSAK